MQAKTRPTIVLLFALICLISAAAVLLWLRLNKAPPTWDDGGILELTALGIAHRGDDIELTYRWRSTGRAQADYWCFTHIVDSQGKMLGQLDHQLLDGDPSVRSWQPGSTAVEQMRTRIPQAFTQPGAHLKLGSTTPYQENGSGSNV